MANEMRDRLVELIKQARQRTKNANCDIERNMLFADHLIENGVVVPPCRLGDTVYTTVCGKIKGFVVVSMEFSYTINGFEGKVIANNGEYPLLFGFGNINKTVFLTKSEAEQKLKEMRGGNGEK